MARIAKSLTWTHDVNNVIASTGNDTTMNRLTLFAIKTKLITDFGFTVAMSCDANTVSSADLWLSSSNIVFGYGIWSWIVLNLPNAGGQVLLSGYTRVNFAYSYEGFVQFSATGAFAGGATNANPTADDATTCIPRTYRFMGKTTNAQRVLHYMQDSTRRHTRIFHMSENEVWTMLLFEHPADQDPAYGASCFAVGRNAAKICTPTYLQRATADCAGGSGYLAGPTGTVCRLGSDGCQGLALGEVVTAADVNGKLVNVPTRLIATTAGALGVIGAVPDLWYGPATGVNTGDTYPDDTPTAHQFAQFDHLIVPWNGTVPVIA